MYNQISISSLRSSVILKNVKRSKIREFENASLSEGRYPSHFAFSSKMGVLSPSQDKFFLTVSAVSIDSYNSLRDCHANDQWADTIIQSWSL